MEKIASFQVNHLVLLPGLYVSRKDNINGNIITTFDIRITKPNDEAVMDTGSIHTIEHLGATFLRNDSSWQDLIVYFGPMGCRTGFYLIIGKEVTPHDIYNLMKKMFEFIISFEGDIPGATPKDCGNYSDMNLEGAKHFAKKYFDEVLKNPCERRFKYE